MYNIYIYIYIYSMNSHGLGGTLQRSHVSNALSFALTALSEASSGDALVRPAGSSVSHGAGYGEPNGVLGRPGAGAWLGSARQHVGVMVELWWFYGG